MILFAIIPLYGIFRIAMIYDLFLTDTNIFEKYILDRANPTLTLCVLGEKFSRLQMELFYLFIFFRKQAFLRIM